MKTAKLNIHFKLKIKSVNVQGKVYWDGSWYREWDKGYLRRISYYSKLNKTTLAYSNGKHVFINHFTN